MVAYAGNAHNVACPKMSKTFIIEIRNPVLGTVA
jgi:hypothetical protein